MIILTATRDSNPHNTVLERLNNDRQDSADYIDVLRFLAHNALRWALYSQYTVRAALAKSIMLKVSVEVVRLGRVGAGRQIATAYIGRFARSPVANYAVQLNESPFDDGEKRTLRAYPLALWDVRRDDLCPQGCFRSVTRNVSLAVVVTPPEPTAAIRNAGGSDRVVRASRMDTALFSRAYCRKTPYEKGTSALEADEVPPH